MELVGLILLSGFLIMNYIKAPKILGLSKDNPKVKTARNIQMVFLIFVLGRFIIPVVGLDKIFSTEITERVGVIINAIIIMYFGNVLPRLQIYKNIDVKNFWAIGDEKVWKRASKMFAYLSLIIGIAMIISSFYFDSAIVMTVCHFIWIIIPLSYLIIHYSSKFKSSNAE